MLYLLLLFFTWSAWATANVSLDCDNPPLSGTDLCGFYSECLEAVQPCGENGYALGYGLKYCERFTSERLFTCLKNNTYSLSWVNNTRTCLQQALVPMLNTNHTEICQQIKTEAFHTHPDCYTAGGKAIPQGPSFCFLTIPDLVCVLETVDMDDLLSPLGIQVNFEIASICLAQLRATGICEKQIVDQIYSDERCNYWHEKASDLGK